jgi:hypothetical protein
MLKFPQNKLTVSSLTLFSWILILLIFLSPKVQAESVTEVTYEDLVQQLSQKKARAIRNQSDMRDDLKIHAGFGLLGSMNTVNSGNGQNEIKYQNGFQISMGIDLLSPLWASEVTLRNFGISRSGSESRSLREFDLKFLHRDLMSKNTGFRLGGGLGTRYFKLQDKEVDINESTPTALIFGGLDVFASQNFSVGLETGFRSAMVNTSADKGGFDLTLRMDAYF